MAAEYISTDDGKANTKRFREAMSELVTATRAGAITHPAFGQKLRIFQVRDAMLKMRDGADNAGNHTNYALLTSSFGTATDTKSRTLFLETDSVCGWISNGGATQAQITAAVFQLEALTQA